MGVYQDLINEINTLKEQRDEAIRMLAEWCLAVQSNGSGWDDWDEYYKDAAYRPGLLRNLIDTQMILERKRYENLSD